MQLSLQATGFVMAYLDYQKSTHSLVTPQHENQYTTWVEINRRAFEHNIRSYKAIASRSLLAPVIKSNAYGHGIDIIARLCDQLAEVHMICVVSLSEALFLRSLGIKKPILVLSILDQSLKDAVINNISLVLYSKNRAQELNRICEKYNKKVSVHIKIDTGLSRLGILAQEAFLIIQEIARLPHLEITGIFTHFADSESDDQTFVNFQLTQFNNLLAQLTSHNIAIALQHLSCSAAITANNKTHGTLVRTGIGIYGLWPSRENKIKTFEQYPQFNLQPVLTWKTKILQVKDIPAGSYVGYDRTYQVHAPARIAILPIGYYDGYDRGLSNTGNVLINSQLAPVIGRIAMNMTMIDITHITGQDYSEVTLLGSQNGVTADDLAQACSTINYEIVTRINPLLPRILV